MRQNYTDRLFNSQVASNFKRVASGILLNYQYTQELHEMLNKKYPQMENTYKKYIGKQPMVSYIFSKGTNKFTPPVDEVAKKSVASYLMAPLEKLALINNNIKKYPRAKGLVTQQGFTSKYLDPIYAAIYDVVGSGEFDPKTTKSFNKKIDFFARNY